MKKSVILSVAVILASALVSIVAVTAPKTSADFGKESLKDNSVITVVDNEKPEKDEVLKARFLNMLNHNFVYDEAFHTVEDVVNNSVLALLDMRETVDDSFIDETLVYNFVYGMYGIEIDDFSSINSDMPKRDGYVFIIPRGYEIYSHEIVDISVNEDGSYTVKSNVSIATHDGQDIFETCETLFVENEDSQFGFNIVYSNFLVEATSNI